MGVHKEKILQITIRICYFHDEYININMVSTTEVHSNKGMLVRSYKTGAANVLYQIQ